LKSETLSTKCIVTLNLWINVSFGVLSHQGMPLM